ncbi:DUF3892 domain-containing protein (plasmid) [Streptomycetaceae bacterium NBC_01309]
MGFAAGFAQQTSFGPGNIEVFIPWPGGGVGHYWFDRAEQRWNSPVVFGDGYVFSSVSWHEGDFQTHDNDDHFNFEMVAVEGGKVVHWWRENQDPFTWHRNRELPPAPTVPICAVIGRYHDLETPPDDYHETTQAYAALADGRVHAYFGNGDHWSGTSGEKALSADQPGGPTRPEPGTLSGGFTGVGWARGTCGSGYADFDDSRDGFQILVGVKTDGTFHSYERNKVQRIGDGVRGRPAVIQSDRGRSYPALGADMHGQYEAFAPAREGGIRHYWRANGAYDSFTPGDYQWHLAATVGTELYDEVSVIQLRDEDQPDGDLTPPLWVFGRIHGQPWVDVFQQRHLRTGLAESSFSWERLDGPGGHHRPERWEVTCVSASTIHTPSGSAATITAIGGVRDGERWRLREDRAVAAIDDGTRRFLVRAPDGNTAWIQTAGRGFRRHLTTTPDGISGNNLTQLPHCPPGGDTGPPPVVTPTFVVDGLIGAKWHELGGTQKLGKPTSAAYAWHGGSRQDFEWGQIAHSPAQGPAMLTWAYRDADTVVFGWGATDPFHYDFFIVRWSRSPGFPTPPEHQADIRNGPRNRGRMTAARPTGQIGGDGRSAGWSFIVEGADGGGLGGTTAHQGWTVPLNIRL